MIRYALRCKRCDHGFEGWFSSSTDFDKQSERGLVQCPLCDSANVVKQIMAPAVSGTKAQNSSSPEAMMSMIAGKVRQHIAQTHDYVGTDFADEARAMHIGDIPKRPIYGETTPDEAKALKDEGVEALPLPAPFAPTPSKKLN